MTRLHTCQDCWISCVNRTIDSPTTTIDTFLRSLFPHTTHLHAMSTSSVVDVVDGTDLTTLVGQGAEKDEYKKLVEKLFRGVNLKWRDVKEYTRAGFITEFGQSNAVIKGKLGSWINHYDLKFQKGECWS